MPPPTLCSDSNMLTETTMLMEKDTVTTIHSLPDELLFDILVRLPANYLYDRARLVCRKWRRIIRSDAFTTTHFQQHSTYGLVLSFLSASPPRSIYVMATQDGRIETSDFRHICTNYASSANGLVVEFNTGALYVTNPATKQSFLLPSVSDPHRSIVYHERCGITYSTASMEYKVTLPYRTTVENGHVHCLDIVTVGVDKSWRRVEISPIVEHARSHSYLYPLSSEGFLHWAGGTYCLTLNVETEIITRTEVPIPRDQCHQYSYYYLSTGRYLSLLASHKELSWEVWEMRPAESGDQWRKAVLSNIDLEPHKCKLLAVGSNGPRLSPLGWVKYPEVLAFRSLGFARRCICYNLETHEINTIDLPDHPWIYAVHRSSLVWLS